jgi:hypothetical protein
LPASTPESLPPELEPPLELVLPEPLPPELLPLELLVEPELLPVPPELLVEPELPLPPELLPLALVLESPASSGPPLSAVLAEPEQPVRARAAAMAGGQEWPATREREDERTNRPEVAFGLACRMGIGRSSAEAPPTRLKSDRQWWDVQRQLAARAARLHELISTERA